ncbi:WD40 repeat domain-containing protein [Melissospora conviva]|uniref:WD40 repeat domain-containing protein n=1 Tax=Melissospora conviva TaxID=3388432 RepID=UPI003C239E10
MTARLRESLHTAAADVPAYPVYKRALATARRSRRRTALGAAAGLALVVTAGLFLPPAGTDFVGPASIEAEAALPDRVGLPPFGSLRAGDWPRLGPASVIFTGQAPRLTYGDEGSVIAVVGADDRYRIIKGGIEDQAGEDTLLSPDGRQIAFGPGAFWDADVKVIDLVTGASRTVTGGVPDTVMAEPAGWSPDGQALVVRDTVRVDPQGSNYLQVLTLVRLDDNRRITLLDGDEERSIPVAFAPDGARVAIQTGRTVTVTGLDGRQVASFALEPETELAGKGAWSPDGRTLTVTRRDGDRWSLRQVDPGTGRDLGALDLPAVTGVTAIRLLGWATDGSARVVAYRPAPGARAFDVPLAMDERLAYGNVGTVEVLALHSGTEQPATLLTAPRDVVAIDVADSVVRSGQTRTADPPLGVGPRFWFWTVLGTLLVGGVAAYRNRSALALWRFQRRARRGRA